MAEPDLDAAARRRYGRQIRLAEVGAAGQSELCRAHVAPGGEGVAGRVEALYLEAAGVSLAPPSPRPDPRVAEVLAALDLAHPAARSVAEGALRAAATIRDVLRIA